MFKKSMLIIFIGLSVVAATLVLSWIIFIKLMPAVPVQAPVADEDEIIVDNVSEIVEEDDDDPNEFFTYAKDDQIFSVSKREFKILNKFNALELKSKSEDCGTNKSEQYFEELLSYYSENSSGTEYQFKYHEQTQDSGIWIVAVIPNKIGYVDLGEFKNDFDLCEAGSDGYPYLISEKYLIFVSSCGTGYDDGSGLPHGCDVVQKIVEPTIRINNDDISEIDISDWQTYRNEEFGFEFEYPKNLSIEEKIEPTSFKSLSIFLNGSDLNGYLLFNSPGVGTGFDSVISSEGILIDNINSKLEAIESSLNNERALKVSFAKDKNDFFWLFRFDENNLDKQHLIKEIFSTFKFIEK